MQHADQASLVRHGRCRRLGWRQCFAVTPVTAHSPEVKFADLRLAASGDPTEVTIDIVRHGIPTPAPPDFTSETPGPPLCTVAPCGVGSPPDQTGVEQAQDIGNVLHQQLGDNVSGIFSGMAIRDFQTAEPFAAYYANDPTLQIQQLIGLNETYSSVYFPQDSISSPGTLLWELTQILWAAGFPIVSMVGGLPFNGVQLDTNFTGAVDQMYSYGVEHPVEPNGPINLAAFSNDANIFDWTMMNVKNPDLLFFILALLKQISSKGEDQLLNYAGVVTLRGDPTDGWAVDSWNGHAIPAIPDPLTELFVLYRDLIIPPQALVWNVMSAVLTGNPSNILNAAMTGLSQVASAIAQTPTNLVDYLTEAMKGGDSLASSAAEAGAAGPSVDTQLGGLDPGDLSTDQANLFSTTGLAGILGELGSVVSNALTSL